MHILISHLEQKKKNTTSYGTPTQGEVLPYELLPKHGTIFTLKNASNSDNNLFHHTQSWGSSRETINHPAPIYKRETGVR